MKMNTKAVPRVKTHEGAAAFVLTPEQELRRSVMACLLWEDTFYESGESIADRIQSAIAKVPFIKVAEMAREAKHKMHLRHVPLLMTVAAHRAGAKGKPLGDLVNDVITRPDDITELLAILWKDSNEVPIPKQFRLGISRAFNRFDEYQFAKYNRDGKVKLRDALFLCHAHPKNTEQARIFKAIADNGLKTPDTWEVALSGGEDKKRAWDRLLAERKLGGLALLRNLRNMEKAGVNRALIAGYIKEANFSKVLPFRFISAAKHAPLLEVELEQAMFKALADKPKLPGRTVILVDNSGSMYFDNVSKKSDLTRADAAQALAILLREICDECVVVAFSEDPAIVPTGRRGFALRDAIKATPSGGTYTQKAVKAAHDLEADRTILITDEQSHQTISGPAGKGYCINVATYENGIGYGPWVHIDGWSEAIVDYIQTVES